MIGLLFLITLGLWVWGGYWLACKIGGQVKSPRWRGTVQWSIFAALMFAPFADEVVGKWQFERLCQANGIQSVDLSPARGKTVRIRREADEAVPATLLRVSQRRMTVEDAQTSAPLLHFNNYHSEGGWVMRYTWLGMGSSHAMLFPGGSCGEVLQDRRLLAANIKEVQ